MFVDQMPEIPAPAVQASPFKSMPKRVATCSTQEVGLALNRAKRNNFVRHIISSVLSLVVAASVAQAQTRARNASAIATVRNAPGAHKKASVTDPRKNIEAIIARTRAAGGSMKHLAFGKMDKLPPWVTKVTYVPRGKNSKGVKRGTRAAGDNNVIRQTVLLTYGYAPNPDPTNTTPIASPKTPAPCKNQHPFETSDEKYVYFDSDRVSELDTTERTDQIFNVYREFPDGSGVTAVTPTVGNNNIEPAVTRGGNTLAFVANGKYTNLGANIVNPSTNGFDLYTLDLTIKGAAPVKLTNATFGSNPFPFTDVRHPTWDPGGQQIAFSGKLPTEGAYHLFVINVITGKITQLTTGPTNDYSPAWSPATVGGGSVIAFTSNTGSFTNVTAPLTAVANTDGHDDIWVISNNLFAPYPKKITNLAIGGVASTNRNPAWSTTSPDPLGIVPSQSDAVGNQQQASQLLLAFASTRVDGDPNQPGVATGIGSTTDIYWMYASVAPDPLNRYTVTQGESASNNPHKLRTSEPDTAIDPNDPSFNFDPNHTSNEDTPTWPQYISSYRIAFFSDRGGNSELWAATIFDLNAPSLLKFDIPSNEIVHVERANDTTGTSVREVSPGEVVVFKVRAVDYESGIGEVYIQIKNPNSGPQSSDLAEHKTYTIGDFYGLADGHVDASNFAFPAPFELDCQGVVTGDTSSKAYYKDPGSNGANAGWPGLNKFVAGTSDQVAFSGNDFANFPDYPTYQQPAGNAQTCWLKLEDDGTGQGIYSASWQTPPTPSDWYIDVIVRDKAVDPFDDSDPTLPQRSVNWKIYDNVWGFTTQPWQGKGQVLFINDYDAGQKFLSGQFGAGSSGGSFNSASLYTRYATESWMTEMDPSIIPTGYLDPIFFHTWAQPKAPVVMQPLGDLSYQDALTNDASGRPVTGQYDIWRIQSRGPVPDSILNQYGSRIEHQPADILDPSNPAGRDVVVAERCVIWHAPYLGDLFVGPGTLLDADVQLRLSNFVKRGGRLFVNGEDVAFGLTLNGSGGTGGSNDFLNNTLHSSFATDTAVRSAADDEIKPPTDPNAKVVGFHPIGLQTWYASAFHLYGNLTKPVPPGDSPMMESIFIGSTPGNSRSWASPNNLAGIGSPDQITFPVGVTLGPNVAGIDAIYNNNSPAVVWATDATTHGKIVYSSFGWEAINPETYSLGNLAAIGRRAEMVHNVLDYLRTGRIVGFVRVINPAGGATQPIKGAFVRATPVFPQTTPQISGPSYTARTLADGSFVISGLDPTGVYTLDASSPGTVVQHAQGQVFHGGYQSSQNFFLTAAQPGSISGLVTTLVGNNPVPGAIVVASDNTDPANPVSYQAVTRADGSYTITLPAGTYTLTILNIAALGFASSVPPVPTGPLVVANSTTLIQNFQLKQLPGTISGIVVVADPVTGAATTTPIPNAIVTATNGTTVFTATTAADGTYTITGVDPGTYGVVASAPGFTTSASIAANVNTQVNTPGINFALKQIPPGSISGLVATSTGTPVSGATITVTDLAGKVYTVTSGAVQTVNGYTFNYTVPNVAAGGTVKVVAAKSGYTPKPADDTQTVTINTGQETKGVNFTLDPLFTFPNTLTLVSSPYEYSKDIVSLLGIPAGDVNNTFAFVSWDAPTQKYVYYPTPPSDTFHLGKGYFMQDINPGVILALTDSTGKPAPKDATGVYLPNEIPLVNGWNLVGHPYDRPVDYLKLQVRNSSGALIDVPAAQAGANPLIGAALFTYENGAYEVLYTMDPFRGYWIRAFQPCTLVVSTNALINRGIKTHETRATEPTSSEGWKLQLKATVGEKYGSRAYMGVHRAASDHFDGFKLQTPPSATAQNVTVTFDHSDWAEKSGSYSVDMRSASASTWDFTVRSNVTDQPVTLSWPAIATVPRRNQVMVTDLDTQSKFDLRSRVNYVIPASQTAITRHFRIEVSRATRPKLDIMDVAIRQTSRAAGTPGPVAISYTLTADATVQVNVSLNGRRIRTVEAGRSRAAGVNDMTWDMKNDKGVVVGANLYAIEVRAVDKDGRVVSRTTLLPVSR